MFNRIITFLIFMLMVLAIMAQQPVTGDSIAAQALDEIVVSAPKVIRKADMDVFYPSRTAVKNSKDGMQLLRNLMIPTVTVNEVLGSVTSSSQEVQVRINGRVATVQQLQSLLPETIKRVEWIENPGLRYGNAYAVLNFVVVNPTLGGSLMTKGMPSLNCAWGDYSGSLKLNSGRSQWGATGDFKLTNKIGSYREYHETFTKSDGESVTRTETPLGGYMNDTHISGRVDYSYIKPDTTVIWVDIRLRKRWPIATMTEGVMLLSSGVSDIYLREYQGDKSLNPSVSAYLEQHIGHNQVIAVDVNGSYYTGNSFHDYIEQDTASDDVITDVNTSIKDRNQAYGVETNYIRNWKKARFTSGVSYTANRNRSTYENLGGEVFHHRQDKVYIFAEYFRRINKVSLTGGIGAQYTSFHLKESDQGNSSWDLRPQFTATYRLNSSSQFRLNFTTWHTAPSLSQTNIAPHQIDGFQWRVGNADLRTVSSYKVKLNYNFTLPRVIGSLGVQALTTPDAIAPYLQWHDDKLVTSYENSKGSQCLLVSFSPQIEVVPGWLSLSGSLQYRAERSRGTGYKLYNHNWSGDINAIAQHYGFMFILHYHKAASELSGETLSWGETFSIASLGYNSDKWEFTAGVLCPFNKYDRGAISLNRYNRNETHYRVNFAPMPFLQVRYNIQWGRQKKEAKKLVNADADIDQSSAKGR